MRKLFLLIPALVLAIAINAEVINITPTSPHSSNNLRQALAAAQTGDIIEMAAGTYVETGNWLAIEDKEVTVRAAAGAEVIIKTKYSVRVKAPNASAKAEFIGVKFDCSTLTSSELFVASADNANQKVVLDNCELYDWTSNNALIRSKSDRRLDVISINNCYFHGFEKSIVFVENNNLVSLSITNSTFANVSASVTDSYYAAPIYVKSTAGSVLVDHCTFYNVNSMSLSYGTITVDNIANPVVSNCIFMLPASVDMCATNLKAGGNVKNCLTFNYDNWQPYGHYNTATKTDCVKANPIFEDAANADYTLSIASNARGKGLSGEDLGAPRWYKTISPVSIPAVLRPQDVESFSDSAGVKETDIRVVDFKIVGSHKYNNTEWAKWRINVTRAGKYKFKANVTSTNAQKYIFSILDSEENPLEGGTVDQPSDIGSGNKSFSTNVLDLAVGTYYVKIINNYEWSEGCVLSIDATYEGGAMINVPDTLWPIEAMKSDYAFVNEDGELRFTDDGHDGYVTSQWGKWNVHVTKAGLYNFTLYANSTNSHHYHLSVLNPNESQIEQYTLDGSSGKALTATTAHLELATGNYIIKIENFTDNSHGRVIKIAANYEGGAVVNAPGEILAEEAVIFDNGKVKMSHDANGDLKYGNNSDPDGEYAYWNINATDAGEMAVSFNSPSGGHNFLFELYEGTTLRGSVSEEGTDAIWEHNVTLADHLTIPAAGTYTLRVHNRTQWSTAVLHSVTIAPYVAPAGVTMTDTDTDNSAWVANVGGAAVDVQMYRTILGGMYNTICLPFKVSKTQCKAIFGNDVELYTLGSATLSGDILNLQFDQAEDIWNGTPILIKTSSTIVNPLFEGVVVESEAADHTNRGIIDFRGTFVQTEFHNGDAVLLLLANDMLAYPQQDRTLKGFRAYFAVSGGAQVIKRARIVTPQNMPTEIDLVGAENQTLKTIENGQLIIFRDGKKYNVMGIRL